MAQGSHEPAGQANQGTQATMEKRLETLRRISESRDTLEARIKELDTSLRATQETDWTPYSNFIIRCIART